MVRQGSSRSRLDQSMFGLTVWLEQQRVIKALQTIAKSVTEDADALNVKGDYFSIELPGERCFQGLLIDDNVAKVQDLASSFS